MRGPLPRLRLLRTVFVTVGASSDGSVCIWDAPAGGSCFIGSKFNLKVGDLNDITFSHDGDMLAGGGHSGLIEVWDRRRGAPICTLKPNELVLRLVFEADYDR